MANGIDIYFKIGNYTYKQSFKDVFLSLPFLKELEDCGLIGEGSVEEGMTIGCRENKMYGINIWENFSTRRILKSELERLATGKPPTD